MLPSHRSDFFLSFTLSKPRLGTAGAPMAIELPGATVYKLMVTFCPVGTGLLRSRGFMSTFMVSMRCQFILFRLN